MASLKNLLRSLVKSSIGQGYISDQAIELSLSSGTVLEYTASTNGVLFVEIFPEPGRRGSTHIRWLGPDYSVLKVMSVRVMALCRSISVFVKGSQFALTLIGLVTPRLRADSCLALETRDFSVVGG